ncbi:PKD domain-containing protein, partial [Candidatus Bipolaricaulota bacterium]|nr:PKD domain-containing protein [Candidatus Bipolaricaulota bacterium]
MKRRLLALLILAASLLILAEGCIPPDGPTAVFSVSPAYGVAPLDVIFDGSNSYDPDGHIIAYRWNAGDGATTSGSDAIVHHVYDTPGTYTATLRVTNGSGATDTATRTIIVDPSFSLMTWNVRGYPENSSYPERRVWFTSTIAGLDADILCIQEINGTAQDFIQREYVTSGFLNDTSDSMDNAVFFSSDVTASDWPDPSGFQHPAQSAFFEISGLSGYVITFHFAWTDTTQRANERVLLATVVSDYLALDPDLIIAGDFNTTGASGDSIGELVRDTGLVWIEPVNYDSVGTTYSGKRYDHILVSPSVADAWDILATIVTFTDETMSRQV